MKVTHEQIVEVIKESEFLDSTDNLDPNSTFSELGIDSLDRSTLYLNIEEKFETELPEDNEDQFNTIEKIANFINGQ